MTYYLIKYVFDGLVTEEYIFYNEDERNNHPQYYEGAWNDFILYSIKEDEQ